MKTSFWKTILLLAGLASASHAVRAQAAAGTDASSFEVLIYVLGNSEEAQRTEIPKELRDAASEIKSRSLRDAGVVTWMMMHLGAGGSARVRMVPDGVGTFVVEDRPIFTELSIGPVMPLSPEADLLEVGRFESSWRLPLMIAGAPNYETMRYTSNRVLLSVGKPLIIGNLTPSGSGGDLFFVALVKRCC